LFDNFLQVSYPFPKAFTKNPTVPYFGNIVDEIGELLINCEDFKITSLNFSGFAI